MPNLNQGRTRADKAARQKNAKNKSTIPAETEPEAGSNRDLEKIVEKLIALDKRDIATAVEKGKLLEQAMKQCEHGEWMDIIETELGWSYTTANRYLEVYRFSQNHQIGDFASLSLSAIYLVAGLDDDDEEEQAALNAIIESAKNGRVTHKMADAIISAHKTLDCGECGKEVTLDKTHYVDSKYICDDCYQPRETDRKEAEAEALVPPEPTKLPALVERAAALAPADLRAVTDAMREQRLTAEAKTKEEEAKADQALTDPVRLERIMYKLLQFEADDEAWPRAIKPNIGYERLLKIITMLQAVYDQHSQDNGVKAKADRAESKTTHKTH